MGQERNEAVVKVNESLSEQYRRWAEVEAAFALSGFPAVLHQQGASFWIEFNTADGGCILVNDDFAFTIDPSESSVTFQFATAWLGYQISYYNMKYPMNEYGDSQHRAIQTIEHAVAAVHMVTVNHPLP